MRFFRRHYFRSFLKPINRLRLSPLAVGRTAFVGLLFGLTATVGVQVLGVFLVWLVARSIRRPINLAIAVLLTGVTNPLTIAPVYALYFVTGCRLVSCDTDRIRIEPLIQALTTLDARELWLSSWDAFTMPLAITMLGSLPFALAGATAGYYFGRYVGQRLHTRRVRRAKLLAHHAPHSP
ncbi:MAG: DUF2062 domain-containing protein [Inquilinus sp.]|nr:DUF2062 domain-containing protein [Inquilinus sp.]